MNPLRITTITKSTKEAEDIKTLYFRHPSPVKPGQFYMIWIPGVDEIPMSVSFIKQQTKGITFRRVGDATRALYDFKKGDTIGIRGPFGNGFTLRGKHILFVGGGTGIAMLAPAIEEAVQKKIFCTAILGVKTKKELFFETRLNHTNAKIFVTTNDGTRGFQGFATQYAQRLLNEQRFSQILTCGPEKMMKTLLTMSKTTSFQASLERYMKCSIGICGQCCIGNGLRICVDGPVFDAKTLRNVDDFGAFRRDAAGRKIRF